MNGISVKQNPYVGLKPFDEENSVYFFGRDTDIRIAANNLRAANITVYYGASGVGKTSLINAGIIPYLRNVATASIMGGKPEFILVVLRDWVNDPVDSLRDRMRSAVEAAFEKVKEKEKLAFTKDDIEKEYARNKENRNLYKLLKNWNRLTKTNFLVILDQFEIFLSDTNSKSDFRTGAGSFGEEISKVLNSSDLPANFMISLRDDALSQLDFFRDRVPNLIKNTLRLEHLDHQSAKDAIVKPLERYNTDNEDSSFSITDELVKKLLEELKVGKINFEANFETESNQSRSNVLTDRIETPFLQLVMDRLWQEVKDKKEANEQIIELVTLENFKSVEEPNPVKNIVKTYLDEVMGSFTDMQKTAAAKFIHFTVSTSGAKRSSTIKDLFDYADKKVCESEVKSIMEALTGNDRRIFKRVENRADRRNPFYEVTHDAVVPAILSWRKREYEKIEQQEKLAEEESLRLDQEAKIKDQEKRLAEEQQLRSIQEKLLVEEQHSRLIQEELLVKEKQSRKRGRIYVTVIVALTLIIGIVGIVGVYNWSSQLEISQNQLINDQVQLEGNKKDLADNENQSSKVYKDIINKDIITYTSLIDILFGLRSENSSDVDKALKQLRTKAEKNELPEEYKDQIAKMLSDKKIAPLDPENLKKTQEIVKNSKSDNEPAIIFIQFQVEDDRSKARSLRKLFNNNGFIAPGIENVGEKPDIKQIQLRYFHDNDREVMNKVLAFLKNNSIPAVPLKIGGYENSPQVRPNQFELWFTSDGIPDIITTPNYKNSNSGAGAVTAN